MSNNGVNLFDRYWLHWGILRFVHISIRTVLVSRVAILLRFSIRDNWLFLNFSLNGFGRSNRWRRRR